MNAWYEIGNVPITNKPNTFKIVIETAHDSDHTDDVTMVLEESEFLQFLLETYIVRAQFTDKNGYDSRGSHMAMYDQVLYFCPGVIWNENTQKLERTQKDKYFNWLDPKRFPYDSECYSQNNTISAIFITWTDEKCVEYPVTTILQPKVAQLIEELNAKHKIGKPEVWRGTYRGNCHLYQAYRADVIALIEKILKEQK